MANNWVIRQVRDFPCEDIPGARIWDPSASMEDVEFRYIERFSPGSHSLDREAFILNLSAPISLVIDGQHISVDNGDFTYLAPYAAYAWESDPDKKWKYLIFYPR